ncbi:hypothetical protein KY334_06760, partial [Candidatus Woesearchaeota archaeon]|nr:hypothetical protein [Candidatus Woesearchaeota archaeon]
MNIQYKNEKFELGQLNIITGINKYKNDDFLKSISKKIDCVEWKTLGYLYDIPLYSKNSIDVFVRKLKNRYIKETGKYIILEYPETHANPKFQIEIARTIALLTNEGYKFIILTHSDYIVKEINN